MARMKCVPYLPPVVLRQDGGDERHRVDLCRHTWKEIERAAGDKCDRTGKVEYEIIIVTAPNLLGGSERRED
jgi:hypothetical protein